MWTPFTFLSSPLLNTAIPLNSTIVNESTPISLKTEDPAVDDILKPLPEIATVTSGTTLPSGKTYLPTKSSSGRLGAGSDCALTDTIRSEVRIDKDIFFIN